MCAEHRSVLKPQTSKTDDGLIQNDGSRKRQSKREKYGKQTASHDTAGQHIDVKHLLDGIVKHAPVDQQNRIAILPDDAHKGALFAAAGTSRFVSTNTAAA